MTEQTVNEQIPDEARDQILNAEIAKYVARGYSVQSKTTGHAVLSKNKRMGWFWNTVLAIVTAGIWLIWVIYRALNRKTEVLQISVDVTGKVRVK